MSHPQTAAVFADIDAQAPLARVQIDIKKNRISFFVKNDARVNGEQAAGCSILHDAKKPLVSKNDRGLYTLKQIPVAIAYARYKLHDLIDPPITAEFAINLEDQITYGGELDEGIKKSIDEQIAATLQNTDKRFAHSMELVS